MTVDHAHPADDRVQPSGAHVGNCLEGGPLATGRENIDFVRRRDGLGLVGEHGPVATGKSRGTAGHLCPGTIRTAAGASGGGPAREASGRERPSTRRLQPDPERRQWRVDEEIKAPWPHEAPR